MISRRRVIFAIGAGALTPPLSLAQTHGRAWNIGIVHVGNDHVPPAYKALLEGMSALGYEEGRNVRYDFRNVADKTAARDAVREFVRERFNLIIGFDSEACDAAHIETVSVPIVMFNVGDPVAAGFAKTLAHPGGNMTGFAGRPEYPAKEMEILREIAPRLKSVLVLFDPGERASVAWLAALRIAAKQHRFTLVEREAKDPDSIRSVFAGLKPGTAEALIVASPELRHRTTSLVLGLAREHKVLVVGVTSVQFVESGALFAYTYDYAKVGRTTAGRYIDRILKGAKPQDLPIEEITEYKLTVNGAVAKQAGIKLSNEVLVHADKVIE